MLTFCTLQHPFDRYWFQEELECILFKLYWTDTSYFMKWENMRHVRPRVDVDGLHIVWMKQCHNGNVMVWNYNVDLSSCISVYCVCILNSGVYFAIHRNELESFSKCDDRISSICRHTSKPKMGHIFHQFLQLSTERRYDFLGNM